MQIETEHGIFTNNELTGKSAEEVYQEWLLSKDKPVNPQPTELDILRDYILELDYKLITIELGI